MTQTYTVKRLQNIYDVAVQIFGSVEGVLYLLAFNDDLNLWDDLQAGTELIYDDDLIINKPIVNALNKDSVTIANGQRITYYEEVKDGYALGMWLRTTTMPMLFKIGYNTNVQPVPMCIDWGDGSPFEYIDESKKAEDKEYTYEHHFIDKYIYHDVKVYFKLTASINSVTSLSLSNIEGLVKFFKLGIKLSKFTCENSDLPLYGLQLWNQYKTITDMTVGSRAFPDVDSLLLLSDLAKDNITISGKNDYTVTRKFELGKGVLGIDRLGEQTVVDDWLIALAKDQASYQHPKNVVIDNWDFADDEPILDDNYVLGMQAIYDLINNGNWTFKINNIEFQ